MSKVYLRFTDHEGDPLALTNEIAAIYLTSDKETIRSFPGREVRAVEASEEFRVVHHTTGCYRVQESFEDILYKIEMATLAEDNLCE